jgi:hypothetical protein
MGELKKAHEYWLEYKESLLERLKTLGISFDVATMFTKDEEEKKFYHRAKVAIIDAINFIKDGEI